jgi:Tfp pilus assembly protein PilF
MEPGSNPIENKVEWKIKNLKELLRQLLNNKEWDKSLVIGEVLKTLIPEDPVLHWAMGIAYLELHDLDRGEKCLLRAMELGDDSPDTLLLLAKISGYRWDLKGENYWAEKAIEKDPDNIHARFVLAYTNLRLGCMDKAELLFKEIIRIDPENVQARSALAEIYQSLQRLTEAEEQLRQAIDLQPDNGFLFTRQGEILGMLKRDEDALVLFQGIGVDLNLPAVLQYRGCIPRIGRCRTSGSFGGRVDGPYNALIHYDQGALLDLKKYRLAAIESKRARGRSLSHWKDEYRARRCKTGMANIASKFEEAEHASVRICN